MMNLTWCTDYCNDDAGVNPREKYPLYLAEVYPIGGLALSSGITIRLLERVRRPEQGLGARHYPDVLPNQGDCAFSE